MYMHLTRELNLKPGLDLNLNLKLRLKLEQELKVKSELNLKYEAQLELKLKLKHDENLPSQLKIAIFDFLLACAVFPHSGFIFCWPARGFYTLASFSAGLRGVST